MVHGSGLSVFKKNIAKKNFRDILSGFVSFFRLFVPFSFLAEDGEVDVSLWVCLEVDE